MSQKGNFLVSLDLGSSMTRALVAELLGSGEDVSQLRFLGCGETESQGWRKGTIANLDQVARSVKKAVQQAEAMGGVSAESAVVGVGGPHIQGLSSRGVLTLSSRPREVSREDVRQVIEITRDIPLPKDREILHMVPQEFVLDSQEGIRDPTGMQGSRLEVKVQIATGSVAAAQNVVTAVNRAGILVEAMVLEAFAISEAVLNSEERELGALVAVLGGGGCEMVAYHQGGLRMVSVVPIGGDHFTNDVAVGLHTPLPDAEMIKKTFGSVFPTWSHDGTSFEVPGVGHRASRLVARGALFEILEPRAQELLGFALEELRRCGMDQHLGAGVIFSGGGARLHGMCDLAEQIFNAPARLGLPPKIKDLPETLDFPEYTTLVSLLRYGQRVRKLRVGQNRPLGSRWKNFLAGRSRESVR